MTRINNSFKAGKGELMVPFSKDSYQVLTQLIKLGVIVSCTTNNTPLNPLQTIQVVLKDKNSNFPKGKSIRELESSIFDTNSVKELPLKENGQDKKNLETLKNLWFSEKIQTHSPAPLGKYVLNQKKSLTLVSKPGKRIYISYKDLCNFNNGFKTYLLRTSKGIITSQTALKKKLGGELLIKLSLA